jgi:hypothetical protein
LMCHPDSTSGSGDLLSWWWGARRRHFYCRPSLGIALSNATLPFPAATSPQLGTTELAQLQRFFSLGWPLAGTVSQFTWSLFPHNPASSPTGPSWRFQGPP